MVTSTNSEKTVRVGVKQVIANVGRISQENIRSEIATLENKGSSKAPMYNLEDVKNKFNLTDDEFNALHTLANRPRAARTPKTDTTANNELLTLATDLATKSSKLESITTEITKLTNERDALQLEVKEILSKIKIK